MTSDLPMLQLQDLVDAVSGTAGALRCRTRLQPAGGAGDKVFPPTYAGAVYAIEHRRVPIKNDDGADSFETVTCVLLDSVQSQANRMEEALQNALDDGRVRIPIVSVDFSPFYPGLERDESLRLLDAIGAVTSLQLPHRIADAILRESRIGDTAFRQTPTGRLIDSASPGNATPLFRLCPTALIFGMWDSSGPKGGLGAKFERAITSEIVGIGARIGSRTQSRRDPIIGRNPALYENAEGGWTADPDEAVPGSNGPKKYSKKLSKLNLGSVTPDYARYDEKTITDENRETPDPLRGDGSYIRGGRIRPGGVTVDFAEQTTVISLPAVRRLRFPLAGRWAPSVEQRERDIAARTVLAALALCATELSSEAGLDLRSRCLLWPTAGRVWELLRAPGGNPVQYSLNGDAAVALLNSAIEAARGAGVEWETQPIQLTPSDKLVKLVRKSQVKAVDEPEDQAVDAESENTPL